MGKKKEDKDMATVAKPIRPTTIIFEDDAEINEFIDYATTTKKSENSSFDRVRKLMHSHKPAKKRK